MGALIKMGAHDQNFMEIKNNALTFDALARNLQSGLLKKNRTNKIQPLLFSKPFKEVFCFEPLHPPWKFNLGWYRHILEPHIMYL